MVDEIKVFSDAAEYYAKRNPEKIALFHESGEVSYGDLAKRARQVANGMVSLNITAKSRVIELSKNDMRHFEILAACGLSGNALTLVNWRLSSAEIEYIITDCEAELVFVSAEYANVIDEIKARLPNMKHVIVLDADNSAQVNFDNWREGQADVKPSHVVSPDDDLFQLYTSGTTGNPKGACLTNKNVMAFLEICAQGVLGQYDDDTIALATLPFFHIGGAGFGLHALYRGCANVVVKEASPDYIVAAFKKHRVTKVGFVPAVMQMLLEHPDVGAMDFSALDTVNYGASPISPPLLRRALEVFDCNFAQIFGMTESCSTGTFLLADDHDLENEKLMLSIGRPIAGVALRIINPEGDDVTQGQPGEVLLKGDFIMRGYWNAPDKTAEVLVDGWYHTGDVAYQNEDGYLFLCDRLKDMIISGGENVYSAEVERVLLEHPDIVDMAVIGVPDDRWGEAVKAIIVKAPGSSLSENDVNAFARKKLAGFKCPRSSAFVDILPRNATGKILKKDLREIYSKA